MHKGCIGAFPVRGLSNIPFDVAANAAVGLSQLFYQYCHLLFELF